MTPEEIDSLMAGIAPVIAKYVEDAVKPLRDRLAEIETKGIEFCGSYQRALSYRRGAMVVHDGSLFAAIRDTAPGELPGANAAWQLAAKAGRDAR